MARFPTKEDADPERVLSKGLAKLIVNKKARVHKKTREKYSRPEREKRQQRRYLPLYERLVDFSVVAEQFLPITPSKLTLPFKKSESESCGIKWVSPDPTSSDIMLVFRSGDEWNTSSLVPGIQTLFFCADFGVFDAYLESIVAAGPAFCQGLQAIFINQPDFGERSDLTDGAVIKLAQACPNLLRATFRGATNLSDAALSALLNNCPHLFYVSLTGVKGKEGQLRGTALQEWIEKPWLGKTIFSLDIEHQDNEHRQATLQAVDVLCHQREGLIITMDFELSRFKAYACQELVVRSVA